MTARRRSRLCAAEVASRHFTNRAAVHFTAFELSLRGVKKPDKRDGSFCQVFDVLSVDRRRDVRLFCSQGTVLFVRTLCAFTFLF